MSDSTKAYEPPRVWRWEKPNGGTFANINRPTSGAQHEAALRRGEHGLQLYSMGTPNGQKVAILLEELLAAGEADAEYDAWMIDINKGDQFGSGFVEINPNSKIPALVDIRGERPVTVFETGAILLYLAGHFLKYAPVKLEYAIDRYAMEVKRQLHVLNERLSKHTFLIGETYSIADISVFPWYGGLMLDWGFGLSEFLGGQEYPHVLRWAQLLAERPAIQRARRVNRDPKGPLPGAVLERHAASDLDLPTEGHRS